MGVKFLTLVVKKVVIKSPNNFGLYPLTLSLSKKQRLSKKDILGPEITTRKTPEWVLVARSNSEPFGRIKVIIPKKKCAKATHRNQIKRWMKEAFRVNQCLFRGVDLILIARLRVNETNHDRSVQAIKAISDALQN